METTRTSLSDVVTVRSSFLDNPGQVDAARRASLSPDNLTLLPSLRKIRDDGIVLEVLGVKV